MPQVRQRNALGVLTKPSLLEIAGALGFGLSGRLLKLELVDAIAFSPQVQVPPKRVCYFKPGRTLSSSWSYGVSRIGP